VGGDGVGGMVLKVMMMIMMMMMMMRLWDF